MGTMKRKGWERGVVLRGDAGCCKSRAPAAAPPPAAAAAVLFLQPACYRSHTESRDDEKVQRGVEQPCSEEINLITDISSHAYVFSRIADLRRKDLDQLL